MSRDRSRTLVWLAVLLTLGLLLPAAGALAQEASPATGAPMQSISREEFYKQLREKYAFEPPQRTGGQVIISETSDISTVNGLLTADYPTVYITGFIFESLIGGSPIDGQPVPGLADSWEVAPDGKTYTFHLNKDAKWHDGVDFTADDVKFSFDVALDPKSPNPRRSSILPELASYRVIDPDTFELVAKDTFATFLSDIAGAFLIMPKHIWESVPPEAWPNDPGSTGQDPSRVVGTGPFKFKEWKQGESVTLVRNDDYWDKESVPVIDELVMSILPDPATEVEALKAGEIDVVEVIPAAQVEEIQNTEGLRVEIFPNFGFTFYGMNLDPTKTTLFQDKRVRQALFIAIDKEAIKDNIFLGYGEVARGTQPKLSFAYAPDTISDPFDYDPERAKQLLAEAGWTDTNGNGTVDKDGQEFSFELLSTTGGGAVTDQMLAELQQRWKDIGIAMTPKLVEWSTLQDLTDNTHDFQMVLQGFNWDATGSQGALFRCDSYDGGFNVMKYCNEEFDRLDDQQLRELDRDKRRDLLIQQSQIVWDDQPVGIFRFGVDRAGISDRLHNFYPNGYSEYWSIPFVWVEQ